MAPVMMVTKMVTFITLALTVVHATVPSAEDAGHLAENTSSPARRLQEEDACFAADLDSNGRVQVDDLLLLLSRCDVLTTPLANRAPICGLLTWVGR